jgi:hypothetical protein
LTIPTGVPIGLARLRAQLTITNVTANEPLEVMFYVNGFALNGSSSAGGGGYTILNTNNTTVSTQIMSTVIEPNPTDYYEVRIKTSADTSIDVTSTSWFELEVLPPQYYS